MLSSTAASSLTRFGAVLCVLSLLVPFLQVFLVTNVTSRVPVAPKYRYYYPRHAKNWEGSRVGYDPLQDRIPQMSRRRAVEQARNNIINAHESTYDPLRWSHYVSAQPNSTTTGLYRTLAMRLNSTANCEKILASAFPAKCAGSSPFSTSVVSGNLSMRICAPGDSRQSPWSPSGQDAQSLTEELFIDFAYKDPPAYWVLDDGTVRCTGNTTLGSFELPNYYNRGSPGPLLWKYPSNASAYDDIQASQISFDTDYSADLPGISMGEAFAPGPLMISAMALFGSESPLEFARNVTDSTTAISADLLCNLNIFPFHRMVQSFTRICSMDKEWVTGEEKVQLLAYSVIETIMSDPARYLELSMLLANEAVLVGAATGGSGNTVKQIWNIPGVDMLHTSVGKPAAIAISVLLGIQVVAICFLVAYSYSVPTWTATLDALAIARIASQLQDGGSISRMGLRRLDINEKEALSGVDGLVGAVEPMEELSSIRRRSPDEALPARGPTRPNASLPGHGRETEAPRGETGSEYSTRRPISSASTVDVADEQLPPAYAPRGDPARLSISAPRPPPHYSSVVEILRVGAPGLITRRTGRADGKKSQDPV